MRTRIFLMGLVIGHLAGLTGLNQPLPVPIPARPGQEQTEQEPGGIRGKVLAADGDTPLAKAVLSLRLSGGARGERPRTVRTDARGEYEFMDLKPGRYFLSAARNGFVRQSYGQKESQDLAGRRAGTTLSLGPGEVLGDIDFKLVRGGVVEGRVADQDNDPLARVSVMLSSYRSLGGERSLIPASRAQTE